MKQILQNLKSGETFLQEIPAPRPASGEVLIRTHRSLISTGTERMLVDFGRANLIDKARQQPEKVSMVFDKARTDGVIPTLEAVNAKLDQPIALGYCNVGEVVALGEGVNDLVIGDRVASNGNHAEIVCVSRNLCARIPDSVDDDAAAFTVVGSIALQGIRLLKPTLGEAVVVIGLGLIGQIALQILRASGCRVLAIDIDDEKLELARRFGAETANSGESHEVLTQAERFSRGRGVDAVLITASTSSSEPLHQAAQMSRKRGRIVLVGVIGNEINRADFYEKELNFQVSCSYGPGRYDAEYEIKGRDYPVAYVRWTEQRNFEAVLDLLDGNKVDFSHLVSHRFELDSIQQAYDIVVGAAPSLGILIEYPREADTSLEPLLRSTLDFSQVSENPEPSQRLNLGCIGSGNYASRILFPAFKTAGATLHTVVSNKGISAAINARKYRFQHCSTDGMSLLKSDLIDAALISTRHDSHASYILAAIQAGKSVFVEKPLCLTREELDAIEAAWTDPNLSGTESPAPILMVGFNRRFSTLTEIMKSLLDELSHPMALNMVVNAGAIPADHWTQDRKTGGGRLVGEACHFIDLMRFLVGSPIVSSHAVALKSGLRNNICQDTFSVILTFADGSIASLNYLANGHRAVAKEKLDVFCNGRVLQLDNFRRLKAFGWRQFRRKRLWRQDKGQTACVAAFVNAVKQNSASPISLQELLEVTRVSFDLLDQIDQS
ncbi:MAG: bi-domain-containing oxidoreductase [Pseudomonadota bacterium]